MVSVKLRKKQKAREKKVAWGKDIKLKIAPCHDMAY